MYVQGTHSRAETRSKREGQGSSWLIARCSICCYWSSNTFQNLIKSCLDCVTPTAPAVMPESCLHNIRSLYRPTTTLQLHTPLYCGCICQFRLGSKVLLTLVHKVGTVFMTHITLPGKLVPVAGAGRFSSILVNCTWQQKGHCVCVYVSVRRHAWAVLH